MEEQKRPGVGLAVIVRKKNEVLLGKRKNAHGEGTWAFPGGHLEKWEELWQCAEREVMEETGLTIAVNVLDFKNPWVTTNDFFRKENKHYVTLFVRADYLSGEPKIIEPEKCEAWQWFEWEKMPSNLFIPTKNLKKTGYNPLVQNAMG